MLQSAPGRPPKIRSTNAYRYTLNMANLALLVVSIVFFEWSRREKHHVANKLENYHLRSMTSLIVIRHDLLSLAVLFLDSVPDTAVEADADTTRNPDLTHIMDQVETELQHILEAQNLFHDQVFEELITNIKTQLSVFRADLASHFTPLSRRPLVQHHLEKLNLSLERLYLAHQSPYTLLAKEKPWKNRRQTLIAIVLGLLAISYTIARHLLKVNEKTTLALQQSQAQYRAIMEDANQMICRCSVDFTVTFVNEALCRCFDQKREQLIGHKSLPHFPDPAVAEVFIARLRAERSASHDTAFVLPNGEKQWHRWCYRAILNDTGTVVEYLGTGYDVTQQYLSQKALQFADRRLRSVLATFPDPVFVIDENGRYLEVLSEVGEHYCGALMSDFLPADTSRRCLAAIGQTLTSERSQTVVYSLEAPTLTRWFECRTFPLKQPDQVGSVIWVSRDITLTHQAEEQVRKLSRAVQQSSSMVMITDLKGNLEFVNERFCETTGYSQEEVIGRNPRFLKGDGTGQKAYRNLWETINDGCTWRGEFHNRKKNGELYWESATIGPVKDALGDTTHFLAIKDDISERKRLDQERQALQAQLFQAQKLETLGTLAGGIAHDFNNILAPIMGYSEMALNKTDESSRVHTYLGYILSSANRARELVDQILTFSRADKRPQQPVAIHLIIKEAANLLRAWIPGNIEIRTAIDGSCGMVNSDPTQLNQVLMNLCTNAVHAMRDKGGKLDICLERMLDSAPQTSQGPLSFGDWIHLAVSDTGTGMDTATQERIFEPFFTTKAVDEGTGLGLSVVHGILKSHGAAVTVESEPGKGSTFHIYFPPSKDASPIHFAENAMTLRGNARILFVDDEEPIALMMKEVLDDLGFQLTIETRASRALEIIEKRGKDFDLVISDQNMPDMTGCDLAEQIAAFLPEMPFILFSGYNEVVNEEEISRLGIRQYLKKPMSIRVMCLAIEQALIQLEEK